MSSNSPNDDARRTSPRKSAGRMPPHYLARETNERTGGGGSEEVGSWFEETDGGDETK